jgi:hypothetical protein
LGNIIKIYSSIIIYKESATAIKHLKYTLKKVLTVKMFTLNWLLFFKIIISLIEGIIFYFLDNYNNLIFFRIS